MKVTDSSRVPHDSLFSSFLKRNSSNKGISLCKWIYLCFVEVLFGEELLENLINTASVKNSNRNQSMGDQYGVSSQLSKHIPQGVVINMFYPVLVEVMYFKYYKQYYLLNSKRKIRENNDVLSLKRDTFAVSKERIYQLIAFRRVYTAFWLGGNITIDVIVYLSTDLLKALLCALLIEGLRKAIKI